MNCNEDSGVGGGEGGVEMGGGRGGEAMGGKGGRRGLGELGGSTDDSHVSWPCLFMKLLGFFVWMRAQLKLY